jgi:hypothetical protein
MPRPKNKEFSANRVVMLDQLRDLRARNAQRSRDLGRQLAEQVKRETGIREKLKILAGHVKPVDYSQAQEIAQELGKKTDMAAEIADAIFAANPGPIYEAMLQKLLSGDSRVFQALASRAYGEPVQEVIQRQSRPFELVVTHIGRKGEAKVIEGEVTQPESSGDLPPAETVAPPGTVGR